MSVPRHAAKMKLHEMMAASEAMHEVRDCTVKALTAATGESYSDCHAALAKVGRKPKRGTSCANMQRAAILLGFQMVKQERNSYSAKTCRTAARDRRLRAMGACILSTSGHVAALVDGEIIDWTTGRLHRIQSVYRIIRDHTLTVPAKPDTKPLPAGTATWQAFTKYTKHDNLNLFEENTL